MCELCNVLYVGETSLPLKERFLNHVNNIKRFVSLNREASDLGAHFNLVGHNYFLNLKIRIIISNFWILKNENTLSQKLCTFFFILVTNSLTDMVTK